MNLSKWAAQNLPQAKVLSLSLFSRLALFVSFNLWLLPQISMAEVKVAFLEIRTPVGELVQFEKGGRFGHLAISYGDRWLHAHPYRGVEWVPFSVVETVGKLGVVLTLSDVPELTETQVRSFLGKPFDREYTWDEERIYCSELVAKLLNLEPEPMTFDPELWPPQYLRLQGQPGLSPDKVYWRLLNRF